MSSGVQKRTKVNKSQPCEQCPVQRAGGLVRRANGRSQNVPTKFACARRS
ncbi:hypothetical protein A2U01_0119031, partial [Trifolium medium]|nr:hypothetical protein [Trifolium medium]